MNPVLLDPAVAPPTARLLAHLAALHAGAFAKAWDAAALGSLLATPGCFAFHLPDGFVLARAAGGEAEILTLAVIPAARNRGLGRMLMVHAANHSHERGARDLFLEVGVANFPALTLYAGLGFVQVGMRPAYHDGGDALVLRLSLPAEFA